MAEEAHGNGCNEAVRNAVARLTPIPCPAPARHSPMSAPSAIPRTITASVWVAALPPMPNNRPIDGQGDDFLNGA